eukprot:6277931-Lingulodinium_polyedra.AAC.1
MFDPSRDALPIEFLGYGTRSAEDGEDVPVVDIPPSKRQSGGSLASVETVLAVEPEVFPTLSEAALAAGKRWGKA